MHTPLSATKEQRRPTHVAVEEKAQIAEFQFPLTEACGNMGSKTVQLLTCEANSMQKRSDQSLPYPAGPRQAAPCPKNLGFWPAKLRWLLAKMFFLLANTLIYPAKIAGFDDKHWFCHYWDATLLHYSCNQTFGTLSAKKRWLLHCGFTSFRWHRNENLPAKIKFQPAEVETSHGWWMVMCFFCLPCWSES